MSVLCTSVMMVKFEDMFHIWSLMAYRDWWNEMPCMYVMYVCMYVCTYECMYMFWCSLWTYISLAILCPAGPNKSQPLAWHGKWECEWTGQVVTIPDVILLYKQSYYLDSRIQVGFCYITCSGMNYCQSVWHVTVAGTGVCPNLMILFYFVCMLHNLIFLFALYI